jgi:hypothetical protein
MSRPKGSHNLKPTKAQLYQALVAGKNIEPSEKKGLPPSFGLL